MNELEKILEEIDIKISGSMGRKREGLLEARYIIRKHMNDGWIPVGERLPEEYEKVMITYRGTGGQYGVEVDEYDYDCGWASGWDDDIIAWRPLPEPYRPERTDHDRT